MNRLLLTQVAALRAFFQYLFRRHLRFKPVRDLFRPHKGRFWTSDQAIEHLFKLAETMRDAHEMGV